MNYSEKEQLIEELVESYTSIIRGICRKFYLVGGTSDDLYQEGMIGLIDAIKHFDTTRGDYHSDAFRSYATSCIKSRILDAIKHSNRQKNMALNSSVSIVQNSEDGEFEIAELGVALDPEEMFISREKQEERLELLNSKLSDFEMLVMKLYIDGLKISEIAERLSKSPKSITNTIQRIKLKVREK